MTTQLSAEERRAIIAMGIFSQRPESPCDHCGGYHLRRSDFNFQGNACPRVKRMGFMGNGNCIEVEYFPLWDESNTIYPEDIYDDGEESDGE